MYTGCHQNLLHSRKVSKINGEQKIRGRCYDHNLLRFFPIFGEKIGVFLKYQCYDQIFSKFTFVLSQKRIFSAIFLKIKIKNKNI
jgi:hypothetical protein